MAKGAYMAKGGEACVAKGGHAWQRGGMHGERGGGGIRAEEGQNVHYA